MVCMFIMFICRLLNTMQVSATPRPPRLRVRIPPEGHGFLTGSGQRKQCRAACGSVLFSLSRNSSDCPLVGFKLTISACERPLGPAFYFNKQRLVFFLSPVGFEPITSGPRAAVGPELYFNVLRLVCLSQTRWDYTSTCERICIVQYMSFQGDSKPQSRVAKTSIVF